MNITKNERVSLQGPTYQGEEMRTGRPTVAPVDRFWQYAVPEPNSGCWLWVGFCSKKGYGRFWSGGRHGPQVFAHRWAWQHFVGSIPAGLEIDHKCKTTACVNWEHLQLVTHHFNSGQPRRDKKVCKLGHTLSWRTHNNRESGRSRRCSVCEMLWARTKRARVKQAAKGGEPFQANE